MTIPTQLVLQALLADPTAELYGVEIGTAAGLPSGTVHPILARLEGLGWLSSRWEDINPRVAGRPARRYYRLTATGAESPRSPGVSPDASTAVPTARGTNMTSHRANPWCCRAAEAAAHVLPPEYRERYALEFIAELYDIPLHRQVHHSAQLLVHAWALRTALTQAGHSPKEQTMTLTTGRPLACRLGRHRWHWVSNEDTRFQCCLVCGQEKTVQLWDSRYTGSMGGG